MAKLDFPSSPTFNQRYPDPAVPGIPVYTWDTEKWVASGPVGSPPQAPFEAMAYSGMQINGGMEVSQERGATPSVGTAEYACDGWLHAFSGGMALTSGSGTGGPPGIPAILYLQCSTAKTTLTTTDESSALQFIEGYRIARLAWGTANAQSITIAFWSSHTKTGLYSGTIRPVSGNPSYAFTYTQSVSNTWEYKTITIPGCTTGTWAADNTIGLIILFAMAMGPNKTAPSAGSWLAGNYSAAPGQINGVDSTSNACRFTGVTVLPGTQAPTAAQSPNIMRPFTDELHLCQRYWQSTYPQGDAVGKVYGNYMGGGPVTTIVWNAAQYPFLGPHIFNQTMRTTPTCACWSPYSGGPAIYINSVYDIAAQIQALNEKQVTFTTSGAAVVGTGSIISAHITADARL